MNSSNVDRGPDATVHASPVTGLSRQPRRVTGAMVVFVGGPLLLLLLMLIHITQGQADLSAGEVINAVISPQGSTADNIVRYVRLPRTMVGIVCGAALGMAGVLMQSVTRNPLASPLTLGITNGAYFALVASTIFVPGIFGLSPLAVALLGGVVAALLAYTIAGSLQTTPLRLALSGVAVSLVFASLTAMLQLFYEYEIAGLFFWGAGSIAQTDWTGTQYAWPRVLLGAAAALIMARSLDVLALGDDIARGLGQRVQFIRSAGLLTGVFLAAVAVSVVGPIGFVGLVGPHLVRLLGITRHRPLLLGTAIWGAIMLIVADVAARAFLTSTSELPAGSVTALIGAPFFIWLARRSVRTNETRMQSGDRMVRTAGRRLSYPLLMGLTLSILCLAIIAGVGLGDLSFSPSEVIQALIGNGTALSERVIIDLRLPRVLVAALVGAALAVSGTLIQGVVRNPLAGPEIVGITGGASLAALIVLVLIPSAPVALVPVAAFVGAVAAFALVYAIAWSGGANPTRLALVGVAVSAFCAAGVNLLVVKAQLVVAAALVWLSGSTYARSWDDLLQLLPWLLVLLPLAWIGARQVDLLGLGDSAARGLGVQVERVRLGILAIGVALAATAVSVVGAVSFVGLIGPHAARLLLGTHGHHRRLIPLAAVLGAILVTLADMIGRVALAPKEIPSGLVTALIGAPYFLWLLWRSRDRN